MCFQEPWTSAIPKLLSIAIHFYVSEDSTVQAWNGHLGWGWGCWALGYGNISVRPIAGTQGLPRVGVFSFWWKGRPCV